MSFKNGGSEVSELKELGKTNKTGSKVRFMPDDTIFSTTDFSFSTIEERARENAFLLKGLRMIAVSYTHLDVYKRQKLSLTVSMCISILNFLVIMTA